MEIEETYSVGADEQLKILADRFQKPRGLDLWSDKDRPEFFRQDNGLPYTRFFPKGIVHSVKPYGRVDELSSGIGSLELEEDTSLGRKGYSEKVMRKHGSFKLDDDVESRKGDSVVRRNKNVGEAIRRTDSEPERVEFRNYNGVVRGGKSMMPDIRRKQLGDSEEKKSGYDGRKRREYKSRDSEKGVKRDSKVLDMNL